MRIPVEQQILDSVTGVYVSHKVNNAWDTAVRIWLQDPGKLSLDGAVAIQGDEMWFASAREGYTGVNLFTAQKVDGYWVNWTYAGNLYFVHHYYKNSVMIEADIYVAYRK